MKKSPSIIRRIDTLRSQRVPWATKWRAIADCVIQHLGRKSALLKTELGPLLYIAKTGKLVLLDARRPCFELRGFLESEYGINCAEKGFAFVVHALETHAYTSGRDLSVYRLSHYDLRAGLLYISRFDGYMYRLDGQRITCIRNGSDDVFFYDDPKWASFLPAKGYNQNILDELFVDPVPFVVSDLTPDEARFIWRAWILSSFFPELIPTKPIVVFWGEKGSGKSMAQRVVVKGVFGEDAEVCSVEAIKEDGFVAAITSEPLLVLDNVDCRVKWLPNVLAGSATGTQFVKRKYYTTNVLEKHKARSFLMMNTRTSDFLMQRDDIADRSLVFSLGRIADFKAESFYLSRVQRYRSELWAVLLGLLNRIVRQLHEPMQPMTNAFRMADFAQFAATISIALGCQVDVPRIFNRVVSSQASFLFDDDPLCDVLTLWMQEQGNVDRKVSAGELGPELDCLAQNHNINFESRSGKSLGQKLAHSIQHLGQKLRVTVTEDQSTHQKLYSFAPATAPDSRIPG